MWSGIGAKDRRIFLIFFDQAFIIVNDVIVIITKMRVSSSSSLLHHYCHHDHCHNDSDHDDNNDAIRMMTMISRWYSMLSCWSLLVHSSAMTMAKHSPFIHWINCYLQDADLNWSAYSCPPFLTSKADSIMSRSDCENENKKRRRTRRKMTIMSPRKKKENNNSGNQWTSRLKRRSDRRTQWVLGLESPVNHTDPPPSSFPHPPSNPRRLKSRRQKWHHNQETNGGGKTEEVVREKEWLTRSALPMALVISRREALLTTAEPSTQTKSSRKKKSLRVLAATSNQLVVAS